MSLRGSQGNRAYNRVLMASGPPMLTPMVEPSGVAFATRSVPRLSLAPGLFSTMKCAGRVFLLQAIGDKARDDVPEAERHYDSAPLLPSPVHRCCAQAPSTANRNECCRDGMFRTVDMWHLHSSRLRLCSGSACIGGGYPLLRRQPNGVVAWA